MEIHSKNFSRGFNIAPEPLSRPIRWFIVVVSIFALAVLLLLGFTVVTHAEAQEVETGGGFICDTKEQIVEYRNLLNELGSPVAAINEVNEAAGEVVCGVAFISYIRSEKVGEVSLDGRVFDIVKVLVLCYFVTPSKCSSWVKAERYGLFAQKPSKAKWEV